MSNLKRPDCFEFAMDFLGKPEEPIIRAYVEQLEAKVAESEKCEPVGVVAMMNEDNDEWLSKLPVGTKLFTSPQPREWVELPKNVAEYIYANTSSAEECAKEFSEALKQLNTKG